MPGYSDNGQATATTVTRIMLLQPVVLGVGSVITALLNSRNRFLLPALAFTSHNIGVIAGIGAAMAWPSIGIYGPAWGAVAGSMIQVGLMLPGLRGDRVRYRPSLSYRDPRLREVARLLVPNGLGLAIGFGGAVIESSFASRLDDEAALPALHNAWLLVGLPVTLTGTAVGQAVFPRLATHAATLDLPRLRATLRRAIVSAVALVLPAILILVAFGVPLIDVLFEHGKFDADDGDLTYTALLGYVVAIPAFAATEIASRALLALRDARTPFLANLGQLGLRFGLTAAFIGPLGLIGIPLAAAAAGAVETAVLLAIVWRRLRPGQPEEFLRIHPRWSERLQGSTHAGVRLGCPIWYQCVRTRTFYRIAHLTNAASAGSMETDAIARPAPGRSDSTAPEPRDRPWNRAGLLPSIARTPLMPITALGAPGARFRSEHGVDRRLHRGQPGPPPPVEASERCSG